MKAAIWIVIAIGYAVLSWRLLGVKEGMHEDSVYVQSLSGAPPRWDQPRSLSRRSLLWQMRTMDGMTPAMMRTWNLRLAALVALSVGWLASRWHLSPSVATGIMLLHPLSLETVATMSGRAELLAAVGVVIACIGATYQHRAVFLVLTIGGLLIGILGKETAVVGLPLVALSLAVVSVKTRRALTMFAVGVLIVTVGAWTHRTIGVFGPHLTSSTLHWALLQCSAAWRMCALAIISIGQTPDFDYDHLTLGWRLAACVGLLAVSLAAWMLWSGHRVISVSLAWILLVCLPRLIVQTPKSYFNEHQFYLALVGVALAGAACYQRLTERYAVTLEVA